ncbi:MAG: dihydropteroate synthase [Archaeoglobi archaeon]|jgi:dihydropteroate synthase|nr:dihydropteroate synthase [Archaeoglobi archaeon]TDA25353.1 MAG: dihydropteroate synthase [Archaeoglobi archaeon]TDA25425.1 MAG: dihydropteroate synthase [Archaeoglobi archaeon]TDA26292.1 MAG: dihydropteroate synthase [Archaeoglobi archaeon]
MRFAGLDLDEPKIMGIINVSPESFYKGSVAKEEDELIEKALKMVRDGASFLDVGAKSTAPYLQTQISVEEEKRRIVWAFETLRGLDLKVPLSADTTSSEVAEAAVKAGAEIVNDVTGLKGDAKMAELVRDYDCSVIICAHKKDLIFKDPLSNVTAALEESIRIAEGFGIDREKIAVDPAIGFFRPEWMPWYDWDSQIIANLSRLKKKFEFPLLLGVSRKSFIGKITGREDPSERLFGSLAATAVAVFNGADIIRTHDVMETLDAIKIACYLRRQIK